MKRSVVALGILGLVYAAALPGASAQTTLLKDDFSTAPFKGVNGVYIQGSGNGTHADPPEAPFQVVDGVLRGGDSDEVANPDFDSLGWEKAGVRYLLLTGDKAWADVSITCKLRIDGQNTGQASLVLRAAPKTKPEDPDTFYELRYTTGNSRVTPQEEASGIKPPETNPNLRIMKVVNGSWTQLAESTSAQEASIPAVNANGDLNEAGATFRFIAKGTLLQGFYSVDGTNFTKVFEVNDDALKAGLIGLDHYDYNPVFDDLLVETVP